MASRRRFVSALATGAVASVAGCSVLDSTGGSGSPPAEQLISEEMGRYRLEEETRAEPAFSSVSVSMPARANEFDSIPENVFEEWIHWEYLDPSIVPPGDVDTVLRIVNWWPIVVGDFSADDGRSFVPDVASERSIDIDAELYVVELGNGMYRGYLVDDGVASQFTGVSPERLEICAEAVRTTAAGDGTPVIDDDHQLSGIAAHLDSAVYCRFWSIGTDDAPAKVSVEVDGVPGGLAIEVDDDTTTRHHVQFFPDEAAARESQLHDEAVQSAIRQREYVRVDENLDPFETFSVTRDGTAVHTESTVRTPDLRLWDFRNPESSID